MSEIVSVEYLRSRAKSRLPRAVFDFIDGGAGTERALARNRAALDVIQLLPRPLATREPNPLVCEIFGQRYAAPFGIAPLGLGNLVWPGTDEGLFAAAKAASIPYVASTTASTRLEALATTSNSCWFQLYCGDDWKVIENLLARAGSVGCDTILVTVDATAPGKRHRDLTNRLEIPYQLSWSTALEFCRHPAWALATLRAGSADFATLQPYSTKRGRRTLAAAMTTQTANLDWNGLRRIRDAWRGALIIKGLLDPRDVEEAVALGVDAIVVSNHGGRQLDSAPAAVEMLPLVRAAAGRRLAILMDGGVRTGEDIVKALCSGADFVLLGRPFLYAAAALGPQEGPRALVRTLVDEVHRALTLLGAPSVRHLSGAYIWSQPKRASEGKPGL